MVEFLQQREHEHQSQLFFENYKIQYNCHRMMDKIYQLTL